MWWPATVGVTIILQPGTSNRMVFWISRSLKAAARLMLDPSGPRAVQVIGNDIFLGKVTVHRRFPSHTNHSRNFSQLVAITDSRIGTDSIPFAPNCRIVWNMSVRFHLIWKMFPSSKAWIPPNVRKLKRLRLSFSVSAVVQKSASCNIWLLFRLPLYVCKNRPWQPAANNMFPDHVSFSGERRRRRRRPIQKHWKKYHFLKIVPPSVL